MSKLLSAANKAVRYFPWYKSIFGDTLKFWKGYKFNLDIVNLGSNSSKYGFDYSEQKRIYGANWAIGPQSLVHDFNILKNYFSYIRPKGTVIVTICPFSSLITAYTRKQNFKYYTILHPATIDNFEETERTKALELQLNPMRTHLKFCIVNCLKDIIKAPFRVFRVHKKMDFEQHAGQFICMWKKQFGIENLNVSLSEKHKQEQIQRAELLRDMIAFCQERDLRPVIVLPPMHPTLAAKLSDTFRKNYIYDFVEMGNQAHIPFLNYIDAADFAEDRYFANSFFMNRQGAVKFTEQVLKDCHLI